MLIKITKKLNNPQSLEEIDISWNIELLEKKKNFFDGTSSQFILLSWQNQRPSSNSSIPSTILAPLAVR